MNEIVIDPRLADVDFQMNPATEELVRGDLLVVGDVVMAENRTFRRNLNLLEAETVSPYDRAAINENQRWCRVISISVEDQGNDPGYGYRSNPIITFVAEYADGTQAVRSYSTHYHWFRKLEPKHVPNREERLEKFFFERMGFPFPTQDELDKGATVNDWCDACKVYHI